MLSWTRTTTADSELFFFSPIAALINRSSNGEIITATADFQTFWENLAGKFKGNELVVFDTSMSSTTI